MQQRHCLLTSCAVVIVTLLCPGSASRASTTSAEEEPLIDQIAMESIDSFAPSQNSHAAPPTSPPVSYTGFKINPNCKCGKSPYVRDGSEGNPHPWTAAIFYRHATPAPSSSSSPPPGEPKPSQMLLFCAGSLINDRYVLTAARCVQGLNSSDFQVWLSEKGMWSDQELMLRRSGQRQYQQHSYLKKSLVEKVIVHPDFDSSKLDHEIALLRLADPVKLSRKRRDSTGNGGRSGNKERFFTTPVCLPKYDVMEGDGSEEVKEQKVGQYIPSLTGTVVSWDKKGRTSYSLVQAKVPFVNGLERCAKMTNQTAVLSENMLCAGKMENGVEESCWMDTGSPLLVYEDGRGSSDRQHHHQSHQDRVRLSSGDESKGHYTLVGVSSWLYGCTNLDNVNVLYDVIFPNNTAKPQVPGVYARVERYRDWITHNTLDAVWCA